MSVEKVLLRNGILVGLEPLKLERADLLIEDGRVSARGDRLRADRDTTIVDCRGRYVMPGLVNAHTHLYASQSLGMPAEVPPPGAFRERLEKIWWKLDRALTPETVVTSAFAGVLQAARLGTTTLIDHHASPNCCDGSLNLIRDVVMTVGLRGILSYEVSDRDGQEIARTGVEENRRFVREAHGDKVRGLVGGHASFTIGDETLESLSATSREHAGGFHVHVDEALIDQEKSKEHFRATPIRRFDAAGLLGPRTLLVHAIHTDDADIALAKERGCWFVHCPTSNANNGVGTARPERFGELAALGTDGFRSDMLGEARQALLQAHARGHDMTPEEAVRLLVGGHQLASELLGIEIGAAHRDAAADFVLIRYHPDTPVNSDNLASHLIFGMGPEHIDSVMVDGRFVFRNGRFPEVDARKLGPLMRKGARQLWEALQEPETDRDHAVATDEE